MIFVDYAGSALPFVAHAPWNGVHLADFVMPFFLFIAGISISIAYKVRISLFLLCNVQLFYSYYFSIKFCKAHWVLKTKGTKLTWKNCFSWVFVCIQISLFAKYNLLWCNSNLCIYEVVLTSRTAGIIRETKINQGEKCCLNVKMF